MCTWGNYATVYTGGWSADGVEVALPQTNLQRHRLLGLQPKISMTKASATQDACFPSVAGTAEAILNRLLRLCLGRRYGPHGFMLIIVMELSGLRTGGTSEARLRRVAQAREALQLENTHRLR